MREKRLSGCDRKRLFKKASIRLLAVSVIGVCIFTTVYGRGNVAHGITVREVVVGGGEDIQAIKAPLVESVDVIDISDFKVRIGQGSAELELPNGYQVISEGDSKPLTLHGGKYYVSEESEEITVSQNGLTIYAGKKVHIKRVENSDNFFSIKQKGDKKFNKFPGDIIFDRSTKGEVLIINSLELETYLKGVIPFEIGPNSPLEALKAQAVTARSLAVKRIGKFSKDGYDVSNTVMDQVYKGYHKDGFNEDGDIWRAVEDTKGEVLVYGDNIVEGLFYSNNGGQTADDKYVWSTGSDNPYYSSKKDSYDTYLSDRVKGWAQLDFRKEYTKEKMRDLIISQSKSKPNYFKGAYCSPSFNGLGEDYTINVVSSQNGYVNSLVISDTEGRKYTFKNEASRHALGLRSQKFSLSQTAGGYLIEGSGYGHGVGMSQNGAINRAEDGHTYDKIIEFYYEGCQVKSNYFRK